MPFLNSFRHTSSHESFVCYLIEYIIHSRAKIPRRRQDICKDNVITVINEIVFTSPLDELLGFSNCS